MHHGKLCEGRFGNGGLVVINHWHHLQFEVEWLWPLVHLHHLFIKHSLLSFQERRSRLLSTILSRMALAQTRLPSELLFFFRKHIMFLSLTQGQVA